jgi:hypothetical protein
VISHNKAGRLFFDGPARWKTTTGQISGHRDIAEALFASKRSPRN